MISKDGIDLSVCAYCSCPLDDYSRTVDHLYPRSKGGVLSNRNKRPCCQRCNSLKGDMDVNEFYMALGGMIRFEHNRHREGISYLKKVRVNTDKILSELYGKK